MTQLVENIKQLRKARNLTQQHIADVLQMHRSNYSKVEKGDRELSISSVVTLADFFGMSLDELVKGSNLKSLKPPVERKSMLHQLERIQELEEEDRRAISRVIEAMLTSSHFKNFFESQLKK